MTTLVFVRRFLTDYARNPVNVLLLAVIPVVFVVVVAGSLADFATLLGGNGSAVETVTAAWAAAFLAGIAMYFQTATSRDTDRRVVTTGFPAARLVLTRLLTGLTLAVLASAAALVALAIRTGIVNPIPVIGGTLMSAVIYVAIGATVGALANNPVNGTVIVLFVWILDVFFGPAMGAADRLATRGLPTHFVTLWMVNLSICHPATLAISWISSGLRPGRSALCSLRGRSSRAHTALAVAPTGLADAPTGLADAPTAGADAHTVTAEAFTVPADTSAIGYYGDSWVLHPTWPGATRAATQPSGRCSSSCLWCSSSAPGR